MTKDLFLEKEMKQLETELPQFTFVPVISQPESDAAWQGMTGRVTNVAEDYLKQQSDAKEYEAYLCGSPGMIDASVEILTKCGITEDKIFYDKFS